MSLNESPPPVRRRKTPLLLAVVTGTAALTVATTGYAWAEATDTDPRESALEWTVTPTPELDAEYSFRGVEALSDDDVWAVGYTITQGWDGTVAAHWDGTEWTPTPTPDGQALLSVSGAGADVWAAGVGNDGGLTAHWTGDAWEQVDGPDPDVPSGQVPALYGVDVANSGTAWAVGCAATEDQSKQTPYAQVWDGTRWELTEVPLPEGVTDACLNSVEIRAAEEVWAVGRAAGADSGAPFIVRWDGQQWNHVEAPELDKPDAELTGVVSPAVGRASGGLYAAGFTKDGFGDPLSGRPLLLEWDGSAWAQVDTPDDIGWIYGLGAGGEAGILLSGYSSNGKAVLLGYDGEAVTAQPHPVDDTSGVMGVTATADTGTVWAVGDVGDLGEGMRGLAAHTG